MMTAQVKLGVYRYSHIKGAYVTIKVNKAVLDELGIHKSDRVKLDYNHDKKTFIASKYESGRKIFNGVPRDTDFRISMQVKERLNPLTLYVPEYKIEDGQLIVVNVRGK